MLSAVAQVLGNKNVQVGAVKIITGAEMEKSGVMTEHYGVISKISKEGLSAVSAEGKAKV